MDNRVQVNFQNRFMGLFFQVHHNFIKPKASCAFNQYGFIIKSIGFIMRQELLCGFIAVKVREVGQHAAYFFANAYKLANAMACQ